VTFKTAPARPPADPWAEGLRVHDWETWLEADNRFAWILADDNRVGALRWIQDEVTQVVGVGQPEPPGDATEYALMWLKPRVTQVYSFQPEMVQAVERMGLELSHQVFQLRGRLQGIPAPEGPDAVPITPQQAETAGSVYDHAFRAKQGRRIVWQYLQQFETAQGFLWRYQGRPVGIYMDRVNPNGEVQVVWLGILPDFRRKGLGRRLLQAGLYARQQEGRTQAVVQMEALNTPALRLYESQGFSWEWTRTRAEVG
jgi:ribosomal protein S18 acetylase RimI-like enzyme